MGDGAVSDQAVAAGCNSGPSTPRSDTDATDSGAEAPGAGLAAAAAADAEGALAATPRSDGAARARAHAARVDARLAGAGAGAADRLEAAEEAREAWAAEGTMVASAWLAWLGDASAAAAAGALAPGRLSALHERAAAAVASADVWLAYVRLLMEQTPGVEDLEQTAVETVRDGFERALASVGLHVDCGSRLWEAFAAFEGAVADALAEAGDAEAERAERRANDVLWRWARLPLEGSSRAITMWKERHAGDGEDVPSDLAGHFSAAMARLDQLRPYEEMVKQPACSESAWLQYAQYEARSKEASAPMRAIAVHERAVTAKPHSSELWRAYVEACVLQRDRARVLARAVCGVPWDVTLQAMHLRSLERNGEDGIEAFNAAVASACGLNEVAELYKQRADALRRNVLPTGFDGGATADDAEGVMALNDLLSGAIAYMRTAAPQYPGLSLRFVEYLADMRTRLEGDTDATDVLWDEELKLNGRFAPAWEAAVKQARDRGSAARARALLRRCHARAFPDDPTATARLAALWIDLEAREGTLEDYESALAKTAKATGQQYDRVLAAERRERREQEARQASEERRERESAARLESRRAKAEHKREKLKSKQKVRPARAPAPTAAPACASHGCAEVPVRARRGTRPGGWHGSLTRARWLRRVVARAPQAKARESAIVPDDAPLCKCGVKSQLKTVWKEGAHKGKQYFSCAKAECNYFAWREAIDAVRAAGGADADAEGYGGGRQKKQQGRDPGGRGGGRGGGRARGGLGFGRGRGRGLGRGVPDRSRDGGDREDREDREDGGGKRKREGEDAQTPDSAGGGSGGASKRAKPAPAPFAAFMPRAVASKGVAGASAGTARPRTNDDFRSLLSKGDGPK